MFVNDAFADMDDICITPIATLALIGYATGSVLDPVPWHAAEDHVQSWLVIVQTALCNPSQNGL